MYTEFERRGFSFVSHDVSHDMYHTSTVEEYDSDTTVSAESLDDQSADWSAGERQNRSGLDNTIQSHVRQRKRKSLQRSNSQVKQARRECNRKAAARCRQRRIDLTNSLVHEVNLMENENKCLRDEISSLGRMRLDLEFALLSHMKTCDNRNITSARLPVNGGISQLRYPPQQQRSPRRRSELLPDDQSDFLLSSFITDGSLPAGRAAAGTLSTGQITGESTTTGLIIDRNMSAGQITGGNMTTGLITGGTMSAGQTEFLMPSTETEFHIASADSEHVLPCSQIPYTRSDLGATSSVEDFSDLPSLSVASKTSITRPSSLPLSSTHSPSSSAVTSNNKNDSEPVILETPVFEEVVENTSFTPVSSTITSQLTFESSSLTLLTPTTLV